MDYGNRMASTLQMPTVKALCLGHNVSHMQLELQVGQAMQQGLPRHAEQVRQQKTADASLNEDTKPTGSRQFPTSSIAEPSDNACYTTATLVKHGGEHFAGAYPKLLDS